MKREREIDNDTSDTSSDTSDTYSDTSDTSSDSDNDRDFYYMQAFTTKSLSDDQINAKRSTQIPRMWFVIDRMTQPGEVEQADFKYICRMVGIRLAGQPKNSELITGIIIKANLGWFNAWSVHLIGIEYSKVAALSATKRQLKDHEKLWLPISEIYGYSLHLSGMGYRIEEYCLS